MIVGPITKSGWSESYSRSNELAHQHSLLTDMNPSEFSAWAAMATLESALVPTAPFGAPCCYRNIEIRRGEGHDTAPNFGLSLSWRAFRRAEFTADWTHVLGVAVVGDEVFYPVGAIDQPIYGRGLEGDGDYETWSVGMRIRF